MTKPTTKPQPKPQPKKDALAFVERHGIVLQSAQHAAIPSLAAHIAGEDPRQLVGGCGRRWPRSATRGASIARGSGA